MNANQENASLADNPAVKLLNAMYERYRWRPIAELHEDMGVAAAINVNDDEPNMTLVHVCDKDFDESLWTHFARITPLTVDVVSSLRKEMRCDHGKGLTEYCAPCGRVNSE